MPPPSPHSAAPNLIVPADYAFEIWTLIYALLALGVFVDCFFPSLSVFSYTDARLRVLFIASCLTNIGWTIGHYYGYVDVLVLLLAVQWASLAVVYAKIIATRRALGFSLGRYVCSELGLAIYFGWTSAATLLSIAVATQKAAVSNGGFLSFGGYLALLTLLTVFTIYTVVYLGDITVAAVAVWALVAVALKQHTGLDEQATQLSYSLRGAAAQGAAVISVLALIPIARKADERFGPLFKASTAERSLPLLREKVQSADYGTSSV